MTRTVKVVLFVKRLFVSARTDNLLSDYQWTTVEPQDWREYCVNPKSFGGSPKLPATTRAAATTLRDTFAKSIKKDPEAYPSFKEARFWDAWNRELHSKAHLHDLKNVLDYSYLPATAEETELFELQKRFMYSVFLSKSRLPMERIS